MRSTGTAMQPIHSPTVPAAFEFQVRYGFAGQPEKSLPAALPRRRPGRQRAGLEGPDDSTLPSTI